jgi:primosomal protein N' (replication factor Y)
MSGEDEAHLELAAKYLGEYAKRADKEKQVSVIGPATPYVGKVNDIYRKILYLKSSEYDMLVRMKNRLEQYIEINTGFQKLKIQFDFNPMNIF